MPGQPAPHAPSRLAARLNPAAMVRRRFRGWWMARLPRTDTTLLTQRNVYILPTGAGWMLGVTLAVLLVASINFQLNLGYLLTFLLAGSALAGMHICHGTLRGLTLHLKAPTPHFAGDSAALEVQLTSERASPRMAIALSVQGSGQWAWTDVPAQGSTIVQVAFAPTRRGLHDVPVLTAETRFPLGTFRVWSVWRPAAQVLVYPAPEPHAPALPTGESTGGDAPSAQSAGSGEFDGVRAYRRGDPQKLIVWKKAAQALASGTDALVSRDTQQSQRSELWLEPGRTGLADPEARIARLTAWVLQADRLDLRYGLRLPGTSIAQGSGFVQRLRCLEALALC